MANLTENATLSSVVSLRPSTSIHAADRLPPAKDSKPDIIFRIGKDHLRRFIRWVTHTYPLDAIGYEDELLFATIAVERAQNIPQFNFAVDDDTLPLLSKYPRTESCAKLHTIMNHIMNAICEDEVLGTIFQSLRIFPVTNMCKAGDVGQLVNLIKIPKDACIRLQSSPRKQEQELADELNDFPGAWFSLTPRWSDCTHMLSVLPWNNKWLVAFGEREAFAVYFNRKDDAMTVHTKTAGNWTPISRAYYKLNEVLLRRTFVLTRDMMALDVGAAPGGWSQRMAKQAKAVLSIDPAALEIPHVTYTAGMLMPEQLGSIIHVPSRVQDAENALQAFAPFHMYTCDMNVEFGVVLDLLKNLRQYLADGALTVVTVKMFRKARHMLTLIRSVQEQMRELGFGDLQVIHLFANKKQEFTVIARKCNTAKLKADTKETLPFLQADDLDLN